jgi:hypothetical protein
MNLIHPLRGRHCSRMAEQGEHQGEGQIGGQAAGRVGIAHHLNIQMAIHDLWCEWLYMPRWRAMPALPIYDAEKICRTIAAPMPKAQPTFLP